MLFQTYSIVTELSFSADSFGRYLSSVYAYGILKSKLDDCGLGRLRLTSAVAL